MATAKKPQAKIKSIKQEKKSCACMGANLDKFIQPIILSVLSKGRYTRYQVVKEMEGYATINAELPDIAGVYRYIRNLAERELIDFEEESGQQLYFITAEGEECLANWRSTLNLYSEKLRSLAGQI